MVRSIFDTNGILEIKTLSMVRPRESKPRPPAQAVNWKHLSDGVAYASKPSGPL